MIKMIQSNFGGNGVDLWYKKIHLVAYTPILLTKCIELRRGVNLEYIYKLLTGYMGHLSNMSITILMIKLHWILLKLACIILSDKLYDKIR